LGKLLEARVQNDMTVVETFEPTFMDFNGVKLVPALRILKN
jgi:hypothetical protein